MGRLVVLLSEKGSVGKSSVACSLAFSFAGAGKKVLLIDGGQYRELSYYLNIGEDTVLDFSDFVFSRCELSECVTNLSSFDFIPSGGIIEPCEEMGKRLSDACKGYDYVLLDLPSCSGFINRLDVLPEFTALLPFNLNKPGVAAAAIDASVIGTLGNCEGYVIINRFSKQNFDKLGSSLDGVIDTVSLPLLGVLPDLKPSAEPVFKNRRFSSAVERISKRLDGQKVTLPSLSKI